jgi:hypothetical protein
LALFSHLGPLVQLEILEKKFFTTYTVGLQYREGYNKFFFRKWEVWGSKEWDLDSFLSLKKKNIWEQRSLPMGALWWAGSLGPRGGMLTKYRPVGLWSCSNGQAVTFV